MTAATSEPDTVGALPGQAAPGRFLSAGYLHKEISDQLGIGIEAVWTYVKNTCKKMQVRNRVEAVAKHGAKTPRCNAALEPWNAPAFANSSPSTR